MMRGCAEPAKVARGGVPDTFTAEGQSPSQHMSRTALISFGKSIVTPIGRRQGFRFPCNGRGYAPGSKLKGESILLRCQASGVAEVRE